MKTTSEMPLPTTEASTEEIGQEWRSIDLVFPIVSVPKKSPPVKIGGQPVVPGKNIITDPQWTVNGNRATIRVNVDGKEGPLTLDWRGTYEVPVPKGYTVWPENTTKITHQFFLVGFDISVLADGTIISQGRYQGLGEPGSAQVYYRSTDDTGIHSYVDENCVHCLNPPRTLCGVEASC